MCEQKSKLQFLDLFTYEKMEIPEQGKNNAFKNCTMLKPLDNFKVGETIDSIEMSINLFLWKREEDEDFEDAVYIP